MSEQEQRSSNEQFYLQAKGHTGNSLLWWREGRHGYTNDIRRAHVFTREEAFSQQRSRPDVDTPWRKDYIDARLQSHVVAGDISKDDEQSFVSPAHEPSATLCGICDQPISNVQSWTDGKPVHTACQTAAIREHRAAQPPGAGRAHDEPPCFAHKNDGVFYQCACSKCRGITKGAGR